MPRLPGDALKLSLGPLGNTNQSYIVKHVCMSKIFYLLICVGSEPNLELDLWTFGTSTDECFLGLSLAVKPSAPNLGKS